MEDLLDYITKDSSVSNSQEELLHRSGFELQHLPLPQNSSASQLTQVVDPPMDSMQQEDECYQTPEENFSIQNSKIDGVAVESSAAIDLRGDTDLLLSENHLRSESSKKEILMGDSSSKGELGILESEKDDLALNDDSGGDEGESRDEETENHHVFSGDVEMDDSPQLLDNDTSATGVLDSEIPDNSQRKEAEKDLQNGMSDAINTVEVRDKFEINDSTAVTGGSMLGFNQGVEFAQRDNGRGGIIGGLSSGREDVILALAESSSQDQQIGGETNVALAGGGLNYGSGEQTLPGARSSVQGPQISPETIAQSAHVTGVSNSSSSENSAQQYVKLSDLVSADEDDILVVAIKAGFKFPRPRWWNSEGYGRRDPSS